MSNNDVVRTGFKWFVQFVDEICGVDDELCGICCEICCVFGVVCTGKKLFVPVLSGLYNLLMKIVTCLMNKSCLHR